MTSFKILLVSFLLLSAADTMLLRESTPTPGKEGDLIGRCFTSISITGIPSDQKHLHYILGNVRLIRFTDS